MFKKIASGVVVAGFMFAAFATDARIETMGGYDRFFADEMSVHRNAANMGLYGNIMYGSYGSTTVGRNESWTDWRPQLPFFGAMISFGQKENSPQKFTVGATFNRVDSALNFVANSLDELGLRVDRMNASNRVLLFAGDHANRASEWSNPNRADPNFVGKIDLMFSSTLPNGTIIGLGVYTAVQNGSRLNLIEGLDRTTTQTSSADELQNRFVKGNIGVNTPIGDGVDLEASIGISALKLRGAQAETIGANANPFVTIADNDIGIHVDVRMFADIPPINGAFVPSLRADIVNYSSPDLDPRTAGPGRRTDERIVNFSAGVGLNINIDRGFFWTGFEGLYHSTSRTLISTNGASTNNGELAPGAGGLPLYGSRDLTGGKIGFGIERNVLTDWFVIRVGGAKLLAKESFDKDRAGRHWVETPDVDHVSLGMGVNIEDRLKIDFTVSQNLPYTFTHLFSGASGTPYLASRVSASFAF